MNKSISSSYTVQNCCFSFI